MSTPTNPLILALDVPDLETARHWVHRLKSHVGCFKIGMQLFYQAGPEALRRIKEEAEVDIFLDLKLHDIPHTVQKACESLKALAPRFLTVHAAGGPNMLEAAQSVFEGSDTHLLGVTVLTSIGPETIEALYPKANFEAKTLVGQWAQLVQQAGLYGVVCSGQEAGLVRQTCGKSFGIVTPGIRLLGDEKGDQARTLTPKKALEAGANYLVIGRPILDAPDPIQTVENILKDCHDAVGVSP